MCGEECCHGCGAASKHEADLLRRQRKSRRGRLDVRCKRWYKACTRNNEVENAHFAYCVKILQSVLNTVFLWGICRVAI